MHEKNRKLSAIAVIGKDVKTILTMTEEARLTKYGTDGWKLLVARYVELVEEGITEKFLFRD
jgi:hypothetical protein